MSDSSEGEAMASILSSKKRRSSRRSRISSESDLEERNMCSSKTQCKGSMEEEAEEDTGPGHESYSNTPYDMKTPRTSERLKRKRTKSFSLPSREEVLDSMSSSTKLRDSQKKIRELKPRKLVNNFLRERTSYVSREEEYYNSDDSGMSDFINDNDGESAESMLESDCSEVINKDSGISSKRRLQKKRVEASTSESNNDIPFLNAREKLRSRHNLNSDSDESLTNTCRTKGKKKRKVLHCSDSDEDSNNNNNNPEMKKSPSFHEKGAVDDGNGSDSSGSSNIGTKSSNLKKCAPLRPRSKRLQNLTEQKNDKHKKMFGTYLKRRKTVKLSGTDGDETSTTTSSSSGNEQDPLEEAEGIFMHSSELEEDDDDRNFIDDEERSSDEGLNSADALQFLKLLDTFTSKAKNKGVSNVHVHVSAYAHGMGNTELKRQRLRRRRKRESKISQWRRIKMEADSEDSDYTNDGVGCRNPPVHLAVLDNDFELVNKLINEDSDCVYELGYRKRTALHLAALEGRVDLVKLLLDCGADRTALDCYDFPAIAYAADGQPDCMRLLLDRANIKNISKLMRSNPQGMNLLHCVVGENRDALDCNNRAKCVELLFSHDKVGCSKLLEERDGRAFTPLVAAVYAGQHMCISVLLKMGANAFTFKTDDGGNLLHFAVECSSHFRVSWECDRDTSLCLRELLKTITLLVDEADDHGFTPLMYACESGNPQCVKVLLENGASVNSTDSDGTSSLHLAAMSGDTECVQLLLNFGHRVDCVDRYGWPPLLYANFKAHESCVLALMKPKPEQVFILGYLLRGAKNEVEKKRAVKVVKNVLVSLANHDAYYTVFNDFIRQNPEMLDENNYGLLQHTWRAILDFDNKRRWFLRKLSEIESRPFSWSCDSIHLEIDREDVLGSAMNQMGRILGHALRSKSLSVTFKNEPGVCTGPKREFFACFCKDVIDPKRGLFIVADDSQYSPVPNSYFARHVNLDSHVSSVQQSDISAKVKREKASRRLIQENQSSEELSSSVMSDEITDEELLMGMQLEGCSSGTDENQRSIPSDSLESESMDDTVRLPHQESGNEDTSQSYVSGTSSREEFVTGDGRTRTTNSLNHAGISQTSHAVTWISCMEDSSADQSIINLSLRSKLKQLRFIGRMVGFAVCQHLLINLQLSKPFVKQILGIPLTHPDDLSSFDYELHKNAVAWVRENSVNELDLPFSVDAINPWNSKPVTIELSDNVDKKLTDDNKEEYVKLVSQLKLETLVKDEVAEFAGGFHEVISLELLSLFTADEFSLLIGGVAKIDAADWKNNTKYQGCSSADDEITWFWSVVSQLKEEEKALLMKFSTGSPCVPIGGFASLTGLGGATKFTILKVQGLNKIPMASTCFNMLKLTSYSSEKHLRDKLLIAIRHGAEGFSFS